MGFVSTELNRPKSDLSREWPHSCYSLSEGSQECRQCSTISTLAWEISSIYIGLLADVIVQIVLR